jgi:hypothetical protein
MNASDIVRLLNSSHYAPADLEEVNKLCRNFPEFSAAHLLKVRILEALGHEKQKELKVAAVYSMDRNKLLELVSEVELILEPEPESPAEKSEAIVFSQESSEHADVIIEQHAPYAGPDTETDLLELDEEAEDDPEEDVPEVELDSEMLLSSLEKDEKEMEEPETTVEEVPAMDQVDQQKQNESSQLISRFITEDPGPIRADKESGLKGDASLASIREHDGFITDTLAQIYVKQGLFAKAIYAYEKLSLKYPEKSAYFAAQIEKIRNINHS